MTTPHDHAWTPAPLSPGRYVCACGATGYRAINGPHRGQVVAHKRPVDVEPANATKVSAGVGTQHARHGKRGPGGW